MGGSTTFSHVALAVGRGDGPLAARLLEMLGLHVTDNGPSKVGEPWYTAVFDPGADRGGLEQLGYFVVPISDAQVALEAAVKTRLRDEPAAVAFLDERARQPESASHVAIHYRTLEALEDAVVGIGADTALGGRTTVRAFRPRSGNPAVDERLDASPVFADAAEVGYLKDAVQAFVQTDVVSTGLLALGQSFELNFEFDPGPRSE